MSATFDCMDAPTLCQTSHWTSGPHLVHQERTIQVAHCDRGQASSASRSAKAILIVQFIDGVEEAQKKRRTSSLGNWVELGKFEDNLPNVYRSNTQF